MGILLVSASFAALALFPVSRLLTRVVWDAEDGTIFPALRTIVDQADLAGVVLDTLFIVLLSGALAVVVGSALAWFNERTDARIGALTDSLPLVPFLLPPVAGAIGWVLLLSPNVGFLNVIIRVAAGWVGIDISTGPFNIHTYYGMVFVYAIYMIPYVFLLVSAGIRNTDYSLEEQSRLCGAGPVRTFFRVTMPTLAPSLGAAALLVFWFGISLISIPIIIAPRAGIDVLAIRIVRLINFSFPPDTNAAVGVGLIVIVLVGTAWWVVRVVLRRGRYVGAAGKGTRRVRHQLGHWSTPVRVAFALYILAAAVLPIGALAIVSLHGFWTPNIDWGGLSLRFVSDVVFDDPVTFRALINSLRLGLLGATLGTMVAALIAVYVRRVPGRFSAFIDGAVKLPATISSVVLAVAIVVSFAGSPFNLHGTLVILILGYLLIYFPQASVAADASVAQVSTELLEASTMSGASDGRTFRRVTLPIVVPGLVAAWALLFVRIVGDLNVSSILSGSGNTVIGWQMLNVAQHGGFAALSAIALVTTAATATALFVVMGVARRLTGSADDIAPMRLGIRGGR